MDGFDLILGESIVGGYDLRDGSYRIMRIGVVALDGTLMEHKSRW